MTEHERKQIEALEYAQLPALPQELNASGPIWVKAIAEITTWANTQSWAIVQNNMSEKPKFLKVFDMKGVAKVDHIYPYEFLDNKYLPRFNDSAEARAFLCEAYNVPQQKLARATKETLTRLICLYAIKHQLDEAAEKNKKETNIHDDE